MERRTTTARPDWEHRVQNVGLVYHHTDHPDGTRRPYWVDDAYYSFTMAEVLELERATGELIDMCLAAAEEVIERDRFADLARPELAVPMIKDSWEAEPPSNIGRFDLRYDGAGPPKLLEYNADTPTALVESAVVQWDWLEDRFAHLDQWNSVHERLIDTWRELKPYLAGDVLHIAHTGADDSGEDLMNAAYVRDCAEQAGIATVGIRIEDIGWNPATRSFVDVDEQAIHAIFKLYPWEWMMAEEWAPRVASTWRSTGWIEPPWKMVLSNKGILPILWELFPDHPNLLPAYFGHPHELEEWIRKPLLSREGANVSIVSEALRLETGGNYGGEGYVFQQLDPLPRFDGWHPVLGSWVVGLEPAGCGIRESSGLVTDNLSRFVPHVIEG